MTRRASKHEPDDSPDRRRHRSAAPPSSSATSSSDPAARALTFGLASPLATRYRASVKTGTSKDMRDNWAVGFAARYTVGVWVGNFSGAPMHDVSGVDGAAPIWREVMDYPAGRGAATRAPARPQGSCASASPTPGALEPERDEWFIAGTETSTDRRDCEARCGRAAHRNARANGAIYAIDPDIPRERQRLMVTARGAPRKARASCSKTGSEARADRPLLWLPEPGPARSRARESADGEELDRVRFEVRGLRATR